MSHQVNLFRKDELLLEYFHDILQKNYLFHKLYTHHDHSGDPEKNNIESGNQYVSRVIGIQFWSLVWPAEG